jgi:glycosyltransferase involved in cell wall biosynthesis
MRLAILMSHASRNMDGAARELILAGALRALGVDARVWRMHPGPEIESEELRGVPVTFCPADDSAAHVHRQVSAALRAGIAAFAPDVVLYKGLGYRVNADVQAVRPEGARWGLIVGGGVTDPLVGGASLVLGEYHDQLSRHFPAHLAAGRAMVLPKQIDLALAGDGVPPTETEFDIVNVGTFAEPRKNQGALLQFAPRHRIAFVGGGPRMPEMRRAARQARLLDRIHFFGRVATGRGLPGAPPLADHGAPFDRRRPAARDDRGDGVRPAGGGAAPDDRGRHPARRRAAGVRGRAAARGGAAAGR